jgi:hypothetical protein
MDSDNEEKGRFTKTSKSYVSHVILRIKGTLGGKDLTISIAPTERNNYVSAEFANQLLIPESNIIEKLDFWDNKQYDISDLQPSIGDYSFVSQFTSKSLLSEDDDIILGSSWMETLGTFFLNTKKKFTGRNIGTRFNNIGRP